jgi:hypothetical protein
MAYRGDYGQPDQFRKVQQQDPRHRPAATPPQWGQQAPPRQDGTRPAPQYQREPRPQPVFQPAAYLTQPQPPRAQYTPPQQAWQQQPYTPPQQQYQGAPSPRRKRHTGRKALGALAALGAAIIVIAVATNSGSSGTSSTLSAAPGTPAQAPASAPASTAPAGTASELQALAAAQGYLSDGQGFSQQGLIDQLDSPDGSNFPVADATWAVDHSGANWDDQAVDSAKGYMSDGEGFSREGLIQQMTSADGDQFTQAQATYAANAVGL